MDNRAWMAMAIGLAVGVVTPEAFAADTQSADKDAIGATKNDQNRREARRDMQERESAHANTEGSHHAARIQHRITEKKRIETK